jgi:glycerol-3-phosphate dehydrogenase (NAD(P)+)
MARIAIIGAGSFGTALAALAAGEDKGHDVSVWDIDAPHVEDIARTGENKKYLPGVALPPEIHFSADLEETMADPDVVLFAVPSQHFRAALANLLEKKFLNKKHLVINVAKGIEQKTLKLIPEIAAELAPENAFANLSGPSHAEEVGRALPTAMVASSADIKVAGRVQELFMTPMLRIYTNDDVIGAALGGAVKNVIALGTGISDGLGYGDNAKAAIMTRGLVEMTALGKKLGAREETFAGLTGLGDLIVTCTSMHSRNRRAGILIGKGKSVTEACEEVKMVVEGVTTSEATYALAQNLSVSMPISSTIYRVLKGTLNPRDGVGELMGREKKQEGATRPTA